MKFIKVIYVLQFMYLQSIYILQINQTIHYQITFIKQKVVGCLALLTKNVYIFKVITPWPDISLVWPHGQHLTTIPRQSICLILNQDGRDSHWTPFLQSAFLSGFHLFNHAFSLIKPSAFSPLQTYPSFRARLIPYIWCEVNLIPVCLEIDFMKLHNIYLLHQLHCH